MAKAAYYVKCRTWTCASLDLASFGRGRIRWSAWETITTETSLRAAISSAKFRTTSYQWAVFYRGRRVGTVGWGNKFHRNKGAA